jgi:hypothetical protein
MHQKKKGSPKFPGVVFNVAEYYFCMYSREERKKKENSGRRNYGLTRMVAVVAGLQAKRLEIPRPGRGEFFSEWWGAVSEFWLSDKGA